MRGFAEQISHSEHKKNTHDYFYAYIYLNRAERERDTLRSYNSDQNDILIFLLARTDCYCDVIK